MMVRMALVMEITATSSEWWIIWGNSEDDPHGRARLIGWGLVQRKEGKREPEPLLPTRDPAGAVSVHDVVGAGWSTIRHSADLTKAEQEIPVLPFGIA